ncbi:MAG: multidrug resistance protein [Bacillota bacterium]|nr:MAG: multidrug resistance protein [Bacillota bacterium]MBS3950493.1 MFS transporter [Peptococcaceae bacterium]
MELWRRNLIVLWIGTVFAGISFSLVSPFLPMLLHQVGVDQNLNVWSGWAFAATFYTSAALAPVWGSLADKYGRKPQLVRAGVGIGVTYILMAFATSPMQVVFLRLLLGVFNGFIPTAIAMVACNTPEEQLGTSLGTIQTGGAFGTVVGPMVGGYLSLYFGVQQTLLIAGVSLFVATLICTFGTTEINNGDRSLKSDIVGDVKLAVRNPLLLQMFLLLMVFNLSFMIIQPVLPIFIKSLVGDRDPSVITGIIFSVAGMATVLAAPRWGRLGQAKGYIKVLRTGLLGAAVLSFMLAFARNIYILGGLRFGFGLFIAAVMPSTNAVIAKAVHHNFRSRALSLSNSFGQLGAAIGPVMGGYIGQIFGIPIVFVVMGICLAIVVLWTQGKQWDISPAAEVRNATTTGSP